jgi:hypothetical protein
MHKVQEIPRASYGELCALDPVRINGWFYMAIAVASPYRPAKQSLTHKSNSGNSLTFAPTTASHSALFLPHPPSLRSLRAHILYIAHLSPLNGCDGP